MTKWQRIRSIFGSLFMLLSAGIIAHYPENGLAVIILVLGVTAILAGVQKLIYYFSMARYMVDGKSILFLGIIFLDFGIFTVGFADASSQYIMIYLIIGYLFYGLVNLLRALEIKKRDMPSWKSKFIIALGEFALGILCFTQMGSVRMTVYCYCLGLIWTALQRGANALKKSAVVYVQQD